MKINTTGGQIHGITQDGLDIFLGILMQNHLFMTIALNILR